MIAKSRWPAFFWLGALALLFLAIYLLRGILLPFVAGFAIAYFLDPLVDRLERFRLPRSAATAIVLLLFLLALVLVAMLLVPLLEVQVNELVRRVPALVAQGRHQIQRLILLAQEHLRPEDVARLRDILGTWIASLVGWAVGFLEGLVTSGVALANLLSLVFITPIVAFFLLRDWDLIVTRLDSWLPRPYAATIREQARLVDATLAGFIHGQVLVSLALGAFYAVALTVAGLDFAAVVGLLIALLSFIPFVGAAIGFVLAVGLALLQFTTWTGIAVVAGIFVVGQTLEGNVLSPKLVGDRVNLHPVWVIFALLAFGTLFGFVGVLLALPAAAVTGVLVRFGLGRYLASSLFDPASRPPGEEP